MTKTAKKNTQILVAIIAGFTLLNIIATGIIVNKVVENTLRELDYEKVGGKENFDEIQKINLEQIEASLSQYKAQGWWNNHAEQPTQAPAPAWEKLSNEKVQKIKESSYILWNPDAKITWIEYSDLECPFCARLHNNGTISEVLEAYWDDVNFMFKHFPLPSHRWAKYKAEVAECVGEAGWSEKYYAYVDTLFRDGHKTPLEIVESIWVDSDTVSSCVDSGKHSAKVTYQQQEGSSFGVTWTPGNVIINTETGEYKILPGAYPTDSFKQIIDWFLN